MILNTSFWSATGARASSKAASSSGFPVGLPVRSVRPLNSSRPLGIFRPQCATNFQDMIESMVWWNFVLILP